MPNPRGNRRGPDTLSFRQIVNRQDNFEKEKIMAWLTQNWVWVLFIAAFIAMHLFGHGGHGGHGGQDDSKPPGKDGVQRTPEQGSGHKH